MLRRFGVYLLIGLIFIMADRAFAIGNVRSVSQPILYPVVNQVNNVGITIKKTFEFVASIPSVFQTNAQLKKEIDILTAQVLEINQLREENGALRDQLNVLGKRVTPKVMASVVGSDVFSNSMQILIDKGARDGIYEGAIAVSGTKLIGRVVKVYDNSSAILPVFAVGSKVPVRVIHNGQENLAGIVIGEYNAKLHLTEVSYSQELQKGDLLVSSGEGGIYPVGLYVGRINEIVSDDTNTFQEASVNAVWEFDKLKTLFVEVR